MTAAADRLERIEDAAVDCRLLLWKIAWLLANLVKPETEADRATLRSIREELMNDF